MKPKTIKFEKGMPMSTPGFADMIAGMKKAWDTLSVNNGYVSWSSDGRPKIISNGGASITATSGAVPCKIISGNAVEGWLVGVYADGMFASPTSTATLYLLEIAAIATLSANAWVMASPIVSVTTGGTD